MRWMVMLALGGIAAGCVTTGSRDEVTGAGALGPDAVRKWYDEKGKDARQFWIRAKNTEQGPVFEGAHQVRMESSTAVEFEKTERETVPLIEIEDTLPNRYTALIDTSSTENWIGMPEAELIRLAPLKVPAYRTGPTHVTDDAIGYLGLVEKFFVGGVYVNNGLFFTRDWTDSLDGPLLRGLGDPAPQVVLGTRFLRGYKTVQFDFPNRRVLFSSKESYHPLQSRLQATRKLVGTSGPLAIRGRVNDRDEIIFLDTAGRFGFSHPSYVLSTVETLEIGDLRIRGVTNERRVGQELGGTTFPRLGLDILESFIITIDFERGTVYFERPTSNMGHRTSKEE